MSQENVAVVQRAFVAWNTGDFDAVAADSASDVVWNLSRVDDWTERDTYSGLLEPRAFWDLWRGVWAAEQSGGSSGFARLAMAWPASAELA
jgi:hypothetical protein